MSEALNPGAALPPPPKGGDDDVVGVTNKKEQAATFSGVLKDDLYPATVSGLKSVTGPNKFKPGEMREQAIWLFTIDGREAEGELAVYTSFSLHEKSTLPPVLEALNKGVPAAGEPLRKSVYVGAKCRVMIENKPGKTDPSKKFPRITKVLRAA